jgi:hypothetical protein
MTIKKTRYQSPSTEEVKHDLNNFVVEAILINRFGQLPPGSWRKGQANAKEWGRLLTCVRRITGTLGVKIEQLAWFVKFYKVADLNYKDFGLLRWKVQKYFKWVNVDQFVAYYKGLHSQNVAQNSNYVEKTTGYKTKEASVAPSRKSLSDILKELENDD